MRFKLDQVVIWVHSGSCLERNKENWKQSPDWPVEPMSHDSWQLCVSGSHTSSPRQSRTLENWISCWIYPLKSSPGDHTVFSAENWFWKRNPAMNADEMSCWGCQFERSELHTVNSCCVIGSFRFGTSILLSKTKCSFSSLIRTRSAKF